MPEQLEITLSGQKANDYVPVMQIRQYQVRFEGMGSTLLRAVMTASLSWNSRLIAKPISVAGCDERTALPLITYNICFYVKPIS